MKIEVLKNVFAKNENAARENRALFDRLGVTCVNLLGGAGSGKTSLLEALLPKLTENLPRDPLWHGRLARGSTAETAVPHSGGIGPRLRAAVLEGDLATTRDAERIAQLGVPVVQLLTDGGCHLSATLVQHGLERIKLDELDLLFIENVGNPICPANFDLGEHLRITVYSVAEGDDKPAKYPLLFKGAAAVVITKCDLLEHVRFDMASALRDVRLVNPGAEVFQTDIKSGADVDRLGRWLVGRLGGRS